MTLKRIGDFTGPSRKQTTKNNAASVTFYKLLMTLSNLHSTVYSCYAMFGEENQGQFHRDLSARFVNEANRVKNMQLKENEDGEQDDWD
jgi:hypothetical protein